MSAGRLKNRDGTSSSTIETAVYWQIGRAWASLAAMLTDCDSCPGGSLMTPHADGRGPTRREVLAAGLAATGYLTVDPDPDSFDLLDKLVEEYGIPIGIHNHGPGHKYALIYTIARSIKDHSLAWPRPARPLRRSARPDQHHAGGGSHKPPPLEGTEERQIRGPRTD